ncbi:MAG TPA: 3D-(3,5/4)-trihydroxycyclohexane-1,2-dione acylhydrolase (decyclizing) [Steroidobacteraceae bacterium]|nr:3D-(3,5/4)-trihydroxycyclohexane-1,2-dione acylhydrolase (decyclizing) [Steroidobacteraceae bacterium]
MSAVRLTMAQALVRYLMAQRIVVDGHEAPFVQGVFAIFGHGNVAGLGEALTAVRDRFPTYRAHNEQAMAHAAIAYAKAHRRRRILACTSSVGPGATNMVTAAAVAHVNRLPVLLLPGDVFASRVPDPVLQQVEDFGDATVSANDCFRPVSRYFDRITRPEQLLRALPQAMSVLTDPADCGPVTLALPQDVQAEAWDFPERFFDRRVIDVPRAGADPTQIVRAVERLRAARRPLAIVGGGVHYSGACDALAQFATRFGVVMAETQAGKGALAHDHPWNAGAIGVTGAESANRLAEEADLLLLVGTRLQDFTTGSGALFRNTSRPVISINVGRHDAAKYGALALQGDALRTLEELSSRLGDERGAHGPDPAWSRRCADACKTWRTAVAQAVADRGTDLPSDAEVLGAVNDWLGPAGTVVCAAGGLPGELHKLWRAAGPGHYHVEYGYSCMGYEIAGGLGVKLARPDREVVVLVGDGSYLMLNSEIATSIALGAKLVIVVLDNRGFGCIHRLQQSCGGAPHGNLLGDPASPAAPAIDFAAHARALGAVAEKVSGIAALRQALLRARAAPRTAVVVIDTDPERSTSAGGAWWDVPVAETSIAESVREARRRYEAQRGSS